MRDRRLLRSCFSLHPARFLVCTMVFRYPGGNGLKKKRGDSPWRSPPSHYGLSLFTDSSIANDRPAAAQSALFSHTWSVVLVADRAAWLVAPKRYAAHTGQRLDRVADYIVARCAEHIPGFQSKAEPAIHTFAPRPHRHCNRPKQDRRRHRIDRGENAHSERHLRYSVSDRKCLRLHSVLLSRASTASIHALLWARPHAI